MNRSIVIALMLLLQGWLPAVAAAGKSQDNRLSPGDHIAQIGDIRVWYRVEGKGEPVLLLHGGFGSSDHWKKIAPILASHFLLIEPDSRGQGRTTGTDAPITYGRMASDAVGLLDYLGIHSAHVIGHSDGGCTTLHLLVDFSDRLKSATLIGTPFNTDNYPPNVFEELQTAMRELRDGGDFAGLKARTTALLPDPAYWPVLVEKLGATWLTEPKFSVGELGTIKTRVLVVRAGADQYLPAFVFDQLAAAIPNSRIIDFPKATHNVANEFPAELAAGVLALAQSASPQASRGSGQ
jgi:pimeloyl-ACP methyl ester carboxylesterase